MFLELFLSRVNQAVRRVARFGRRESEALLKNAGIVRNRLKISGLRSA